MRYDQSAPSTSAAVTWPSPRFTTAGARADDDLGPNATRRSRRLERRRPARSEQLRGPSPGPTRTRVRRAATRVACLRRRIAAAAGEDEARGHDRGHEGSGTRNRIGTKMSCPVRVAVADLEFDARDDRVEADERRRAPAGRCRSDGSQTTRRRPRARTPRQPQRSAKRSRAASGLACRSRVAPTSADQTSPSLALSARAYTSPKKLPLLRTFVHPKLHRVHRCGTRTYS